VSVNVEDANNHKNKRVVRCPVLLSPHYSVERELLDTLDVVPKREKSSFLRELILLGYSIKTQHDKAEAETYE
jgi:hypothetical protein